MAVNFGTFVGQGSIRQAVLGLENRKATPDEILKEKDLTRQAMQDGAFGLSTGLFYVPGNLTPTEELIELAKVVAKFGWLRTQVTHHKIIGAENWGKSVETLRLIEEARARGVDATIDAYPYTDSSTGTAALFPHPTSEPRSPPRSSEEFR